MIHNRYVLICMYISISDFVLRDRKSLYMYIVLFVIVIGNRFLSTLDRSFPCVTLLAVISLQVLPHARLSGLSKLSRATCQERFVSPPRGAPVCERPVQRLNAVFTCF